MNLASTYPMFQRLMINSWAMGALAWRANGIGEVHVKCYQYGKQRQRLNGK